MSMISRQKLIEELESLDKYFVEALPLNSETVFIAGEVRELIESQPPADQWIPCSERLPEDSNTYEVTVYFDGLLFTTNSYYSTLDLRWTTYTYNIIAWRERLSKPYKGE